MSTDLFDVKQPAAPPVPLQAPLFEIRIPPPVVPAAAPRRRPRPATSGPSDDLFSVRSAPPQPDRAPPPPPSRPPPAGPQVPAPDFPASAASVITWSELISLFASFARDPRPGVLRAGAIAADLRAVGVDFPELDSISSGAAAAVAHRAPATTDGHAGLARRWVEWADGWSPQLLASPVAATLPVVVAAYIRARRNVRDAKPPPSARWPRAARHPSPGPYIEVSSLDSEVGRFLGLLNVLLIPHRPYGGPFPHALLRVMGALDKRHKSVKSPLFVWQVLAVFRALWPSLMALDADAASGFCALALICIGVLRPGFATAITAQSATVMPASFGLAALLVEWHGSTKAKPARLPEAQGGPGPATVPVVTCIGHRLFGHTLLPFLRDIRSAARAAAPLFPRCRRVPDSVLHSTHERHLFTWGGSQLWEATDRPWSHEALTRLARDLLTRSGFPGALPFASGPHAGRLGGEMEGEELGWDAKVRDVVGQWAILKRRQHEHYEATAIERMARYTASLGRLPMTSTGLGSVRLGLPAGLDLERLSPFIRALGPVDPHEPAGAWIPAFVATVSNQPRPPPQPVVPPLPRAHEDVDSEADAADEAEAIWGAEQPRQEADASPLRPADLAGWAQACAAAAAAAIQPVDE